MFHACMTDHTHNEETTLVLGGTGKTGRRVVERLAARGVPDARRLALRRAAVRLGGPRHLGARAARRHAPSYVVLLSGPGGPGAAGRGRRLRRAGRRAGGSGGWCCCRAAARRRRSASEQVVQGGRRRLDDRAVQLVQPELQRELHRSTACWTAWSRCRSSDVREPFVDVEDIADVAVAALTEDGHAGELYELTGPRLLTFAEAVQRDRGRDRTRRCATCPVTMDEFTSAR